MRRLEQIYDVLCIYGVEKYVSFDLGMLSKYRYYTGVIMKAYTYGVGDAIVTGGRYDKLLGYFGKAKPAIGFMIAIDSLMEAISRQKLPARTEKKVSVIAYGEDSFETALAEAKVRRNAGEAVELIPEVSDK